MCTTFPRLLVCAALAALLSFTVISKAQQSYIGRYDAYAGFAVIRSEGTSSCARPFPVFLYAPPWRLSSVSPSSPRPSKATLAATTRMRASLSSDRRALVHVHDLSPSSCMRRPGGSPQFHRHLQGPAKLHWPLRRVCGLRCHPIGGH